MKANPVTYCTFIIRSQIEYSKATHALTMRCILEMPVTGQHFGFTDVDALLAVLRAELLEMQYRIIPIEQEKGKF